MECFLFFVHVCMCVYAHTHMCTLSLWRSEANALRALSTFFLKLYFLIIYFVCTCEVGSLLLPCGYWLLKPSHQAW